MAELGILSLKALVVDIRGDGRIDVVSVFGLFIHNFRLGDQNSFCRAVDDELLNGRDELSPAADGISELVLRT
jgi:hypothetical protein